MFRILKQTIQGPAVRGIAATPPRDAAPPVTAGGGHSLKGAQCSPLNRNDYDKFNQQILATHAPDHEVLDVKPVFSIIEYILQRSEPLETVHGDRVPAHSESYEKSFQSAYDTEIFRKLADPINKIITEITCKCGTGGEIHSVANGILEKLSNYEWDAKVVITFAAFSVSYGEFWLTENLRAKNQLAKDIAALKNLPEPLKHKEELKKKFEAVVKLLKAVLTVTRIIIQIREHPIQYIKSDSQEMVTVTALIPTIVYWIITSILSCASILLNLIGSGQETHALLTPSPNEYWDILSLANKLSHMSEDLQKEQKDLNVFIETTKRNKEYAALKKLFETSHTHNMKILKRIIRSGENQLPIFDGTRSAGLRILKRKYVLLLISNLDLHQEELNILCLIYNQKPRQYEVLWLPIVDQATPMNSTKERQFLDLRSSMPWYSVDHPSLVNRFAIMYIRENWNFSYMPILVVLDPKGRVLNVNALPVLWIWGSHSYPFTKERECRLWRESTWNIDLLADSIDPRIQEWKEDKKIICLYGGEEIDWIRKFTTTVRRIANTLHVPLEMIYVGRRNPKDKVRRCHEIIHRDQLSHIFSLKDYYDYVWFFWLRLESMLTSKFPHGMTIEPDEIMREIKTILTFDSSEQGWAVFSRGLYDMTKGKGDILLTVLDNFDKWGHRVDHPVKFVPVLKEEISGVLPEHHCNRLILPGHTGNTPEPEVCSDCGRIMDNFFMYSCCTD